MSLRAQILLALASLGPSVPGPHTLAVSATGVDFQAELTALDQLAVAFANFRVTLDRLSAAPMERLKQVAGELSRRLTYLLEPISPIEVDAEQCVVQMRSTPPQKDDTGATYYEILVARGGQLSLARYQKPRGQERQPIAAQVTREVFLRLADDFAAAGAVP